MNEVIINTSQMRNFEQLDKPERKKVMQYLKTLNYNNNISIIRFGSESSKELSEISTQMISEFEVQEFEEAQELILELIEGLKIVEPEALIEKENAENLFKIPFLEKKEGKKVIKVCEQHKSLEKQIDSLEDKLVYMQLGLIRDIEFCSKMAEKTSEYAKEQELQYIAIQEAIKKANVEKQCFEELIQQNPNNIEYPYKIAEINSAIKRLEDKAYNLVTFRIATLQSMAQIQFVASGDELMVSKIDDTIMNVIPLWKRNFSIAIAIYRLNNSAKIDRILKIKTKELFKQNSMMLKNTMLQIAEDLENPILDAETLKSVNNDLEETFKSLNEISKQANALRSNAVKIAEGIQTTALGIQVQKEN